MTNNPIKTSTETVSEIGNRLALAAIRKVGCGKFSVWSTLDIEKPKTITNFRTFADLLAQAYVEGAQKMAESFDENPVALPLESAPDFLEPLYRWLARARFEKPSDEVMAVNFGNQITQALAQRTGSESVPTGRCVTLSGECQCEPGQQQGCVSWRSKKAAAPLGLTDAQIIAIRKAVGKALAEELEGDTRVTRSSAPSGTLMRLHADIFPFRFASAIIAAVAAPEVNTNDFTLYKSRKSLNAAVFFERQEDRDKYDELMDRSAKTPLTDDQIVSKFRSWLGLIGERDAILSFSKSLLSDAKASQ